MSLGGLAVAIGLVIDDAVVVVENIERRLALHPADPPAEVIRRGTDEIFGPVASSTLTTVVVFAPLGLLQGVVGEFFRGFAFGLAVAVLGSLVLALTLIPTLVAHWIARRPASASTATETRSFPHFSLAWLDARYGAAVAWLVGHRRSALAAAGALIVAAGLLTRIMGTGFLPQMDEGGFILDYWTPTGSSLAETDRQMKIIEGILGADPDIQAFTRRTGAELGFAATAPNSGDFTVLLKPRRERSASVYTVIDRVRTAAEARAPAVRVEFIQLLQDVIGDLAGAPAPVELKLFGVDRGATEAAARQVAAAIAPVSGLVDLFNGVPGDNPEVRIDLDPVRITRLGLSAAEVETQARDALFGVGAGSAREPDRLVPIRVRVPDSLRFHPDVVSALPILGPGGWVPLSDLGVVRDTVGASELLRENLRPLVAVTGQVEERSLGAVMRDIRAAASGVALPAGVTLEYGGQYASQQQSFRELLGVLALATGAVLMVLVAQFNSLRGPLAIVLAIPFGLTGAVMALAAARVPFNVSSFMGVILLVGLIVKNGILLFDAAQDLHAGGASVRDALVGAGRLRLRPILMTTLCTLAGLVPLALGWGAGAELQRPLAIAVIGGLIVSTAVTLLLLPTALEAVGALHKIPPQFD
jgi:multidrug efflux pump subunit AcrB